MLTHSARSLTCSPKKRSRLGHFSKTHDRPLKITDKVPRSLSPANDPPLHEKEFQPKRPCYEIENGTVWSSFTGWFCIFWQQLVPDPLPAAPRNGQGWVIFQRRTIDLWKSRIRCPVHFLRLTIPPYTRKNSNQRDLATKLKMERFEAVLLGDFAYSDSMSRHRNTPVIFSG